MTRKLNFGCGPRFAEGWVNIDFHSVGPAVQQVNLLGGFPFPDASFDAVYSSHVIEHFSFEQAYFLLGETYRVLRQGGVARIVVPDLEASCREYLRILELPDEAPGKQKFYDWIVVELIDQLVRNTGGGRMAEMMRRTRASGDVELIDYIRSRTGNAVHAPVVKKGFVNKLSGLNFQKLKTRVTYLWLRAVSRLISADLRPLVFVNTSVGERHQWMYDRYGLESLVRAVGFKEIRLCTFDQSAIPDFNRDGLDCLPSGEPYKNVSVYLEAIR